MAYTLFVVLIVLASLLMIFIVLIQESKGGGLASNFSSTNSIMGVRKTTDLVEKLTWGLAAAMAAMPGANSDAAKKVAPAAQKAAPAAQNAAEKAAPAVPATPAK